MIIIKKYKFTKKYFSAPQNGIKPLLTNNLKGEKMKVFFETAEHISAKASINDILAEVRNSITAKNILIITTLMCLFGFATACENKITDAKDHTKKDDDEQQSGDLSLVGTKWKLTAFVDAENDIHRELDYIHIFDSAKQFTVSFNDKGFIYSISQFFLRNSLTKFAVISFKISF